MPPEAPGLRAMASAADATALPCPNPHRPAAIPMARDAKGRLRSSTPPPPAVGWAKIGLATSRNATARKIILRVIWKFSLLEIVREEVVPNLSGGTTGSRSERIMPLFFVCHCSTHVDHGQQHEYKCL